MWAASAAELLLGMHAAGGAGNLLPRVLLVALSVLSVCYTQAQTLVHVVAPAHRVGGRPVLSHAIVVAKGLQG